MDTTENNGNDGQIITMYAPIFREKLNRLERLGRGHCEEAVRLRKTLARVHGIGPANDSTLGRELITGQSKLTQARHRTAIHKSLQDHTI